MIIPVRRKIKKKNFWLRHLKRKPFLEKRRQIIRKNKKHRNLPSKIRNKRTRKTYSSPIKLTAPKIFSVIKNTDEIIKYVDTAKQHLHQGKVIEFDVQRITEMDPATLTYLCALISNPHFSKKTPIKGNYPLDKNLNKMFQKSGFPKYVKSLLNKNDFIQNTDVYNEIIHTVSRKKVKPDIAREVVVRAIEYSQGDRTAMFNLINILVECMDNTITHAWLGDDIYNWWLHAYQEPGTMITKFCFLDLGVGIFTSLEHKYKSKSLPEKFKNFFVPDSHTQTIHKMLTRGHISSTNLPERGKGINDFYVSLMKSPNIKNFTILSNDIITKIEYNCQIKTDKIDNTFDGTLYYWELHP